MYKKNDIIPNELRPFFDNSPDMISFKDVNLVYRGVSKAFALLVGLSEPENVIGKTDFDLFNSKELSAKYAEDDRRVIKSGEPMLNFTEPLPELNGVTRWASTSKYPIKDNLGNIIGICGVSRHISSSDGETSQSTEYRESMDRYHIALSNVRTSIWDFDYATKSIIQSPHSLEVHGFDVVIPDVPESLIESGYIHPDYAAAFIEMYRKLYAGAKHASGVFRVKSEGDNDYWYEHIRYTNLFDENGKPHRAVGMSEDVTEKYEAKLSYNRELSLQMVMAPDMIGTLLIDIDAWKVVRSRFSDSQAHENYGHQTPDDYAMSALSSIIDDNSVKEFFTSFTKDKLLAMHDSGKQKFFFEYLRSMPDGSERWVRDEGRYITDPESGHLMLFLALRDVDIEKRQMEELTQAAETDAMTGLLNHDATIKHIERFMEKEAASGTHALFMVDIDSFKTVNDSLGHRHGDTVIMDIAAATKSVFRQSDIVGRVGGDEFLVFMKNIGSIRSVRRKARDLISSLQFKVTSDDTQIDLSASVGISLMVDGEKTFDQLYREADASLYRAKSEGKNRYCVFHDLTDSDEILNPPSVSDQASVLQLRTLLEHMDAGVVVAKLDDDIRISYVSPSFYKTMGRTIEETGETGENLLSLIFPDDLDMLKAEVKKAASGELADCVYRVGENGAIWRHLRAACLPQTGDESSKDSITVIAVITDITEMMNSQEQLRIAEARYRIAMEQTAGLIWEVDIASHTLYQSKDVSRTFGANETVYNNAPESVLKLNIFHPDSVDEYRRMFNDIYSKVNSGIYMLHIKDSEGEYVRVKASFEFLRDSNGTPFRAIGVSEILANVEPELRAFENECTLIKMLTPSLLGSNISNLTRNTVETYTFTKKKLNPPSSYTNMCLEMCVQMPYSEDALRFSQTMSRENLIASYQQGQMWRSCEFRRGEDDGAHAWTSYSTKLLRQPITGDIYAFTICRDIENIYEWELKLGEKRIKRDSSTFLYSRETLCSLWNLIQAQASKNAHCSVTVLELYDLERAKAQLGMPAVGKLLIDFGRICHALIEGATAIGHLDESHVAIFRIGVDSPQEQISIATKNNEHIKLVLSRTNPELEFELICGFTYTDKNSTDFDELVRQASVACALSHKLPNHPICRYSSPGVSAPLYEPQTNLPKACRILVADDDIISRTQLKYMLSSVYTVDEAEDGEKALQMIAQKNYSLIISDISMPGKTGWELIDEIRGRGKLTELPIVIITSDGRTETKIKSLELGASDIIVKPFDANTLFFRVQNIIDRQEASRVAEQNRIYQLRLEQQEQLLQAAEYDDITGLYNRHAFYRRVRERLDTNPDNSYCIIRWDLDNFKMLNDFLGVAAGDKVLRDIATNIRNNISPDCILARLESDHFVSFSVQSKSKFDEVYTQALKWIESYPMDFRFSFRIGIYQIDDPSIEVELMCDRALLALRSVKNNFASHIAYYDNSLRELLIEEQELLGRMGSALANEQFELYFQPQFDHCDNSAVLIGAEALVRWNHPERGLLTPGSFIPLFEKNGFIMNLDQFVWERACKHLRDWLDRGLNPFPISVNISRLNVYNPRLVDTLYELIQKYKLDIKLLRLEITESAYMEDPMLLIEVVKQLREKGFFVEMDDFGSGYSSLSTLKDVPMDMLKLDMKFLTSSNENERVGIVINSVLRMANWLNLPVIAEGVETKRQADYLKTVGCSLVQGFLFAKPMPVLRYEQLMMDANRSTIQNQAALETLFDNEEFFSPESQATVIFNSFVGAAGIFEYHDGKLAALRINDKYYKEIETTRSAFNRIKENVLSTVYAQDRAELLRALDETALNGIEIQNESRWHNVDDGHVFWLKIHARRIAKSKEMCAIYLGVENITERKSIEEKKLGHLNAEIGLINSHGAEAERNSIIVDSLRVLVFDYSYDTDTIAYELTVPQKGHIKQIKEKYLENISTSSAIHPDFVERFKNEFFAVQDKARQGTFEFLMNISGSGYRWNRANWISVPDESGHIYRIVGVVNDIQNEKDRDALISRLENDLIVKQQELGNH